MTKKDQCDQYKQKEPICPANQKRTSTQKKGQYEPYNQEWPTSPIGTNTTKEDQYNQQWQMQLIQPKLPIILKIIKMNKKDQYNKKYQYNQKRPIPQK